MNCKVAFESQMMGLEHNQSSDGRALIELMLATGLTELMLCWFTNRSLIGHSGVPVALASQGFNAVNMLVLS